MKLLYKFIFCFLLICLFFCPLRAQEQVAIQTEHQKLSLYKNFSSSIFTSPSQMFYSGIIPFSELRIHFDNEREKYASTLQKGDASTLGGIQIASLVALSPKEKFWGSAYYKKGLFKNIRWNETSDFETIYPYIMGDSIGGNLKSEEYAFSGGFVKKMGKYTLSTNLEYRGLLEFRQLDPRPKNIVLDIFAGLGGGYLISPKVNLGLDVKVGKYRQSNNVKFYSEKGISPIYHFIGLARHYARFYGDKSSVFYDGNNSTTTLSIHHTDNQGFSALLTHKWSSFEKIIDRLNYIPLSLLNKHKISAILNYQQKLNSSSWGIQFVPTIEYKNGRENIFGDAVLNSYPIIATLNKFFYTEKSMLMIGFFENYLGPNFCYSLSPSFKYFRQKESYKLPNRTQNFDCFIAEMASSAQILKKKHLFKVLFTGTYKGVINAKMILGDLGNDAIFSEMLDNNFLYSSSSCFIVSMSASWNYAISEKTLAFLELNSFYKNYNKNSNQTNGISFNCGIKY